MKTFIYLIVWCAIFNENQSQPTEKYGDTDINTPKNYLKEVTAQSSHPPQDFSNETNHNEVVNNTTQENKDANTKKMPDEIVHKIPESSESTEKINNSTRTPLTTTINNSTRIPLTITINNSTRKPLTTTMVPPVSSQTDTTFTPRPSPLVKERPYDPNSINLPKYGMGLIVFAMALMFFIIMALLFMLYKLKQDKRQRDSMNVTILQPKNEMNHKYSRHLSGEESNVSTLLKDKSKDSKLILTRSDSNDLFINNLDTIDATNGKPYNNDIKTSRINIPEHNPSTPKPRPTLARILKQPSINDVPITREQMLKVCEGVLAKKNRFNEATSLSDLEKISKESNEEEKEKTDLEKCLSTPELDSDMYDVLPTPSPRKFFNNTDRLKNEDFEDEVYDNPPKHDIKKYNNSIKKHKNEETNDEVYDNPVPNQHDNEVFDDGIYDNPPPNNSRKRNVVVSTDHEDYVMPLTKDNGLYGNAKEYADNKICTK